MLTGSALCRHLVAGRAHLFLCFHPTQCSAHKLSQADEKVNFKVQSSTNSIGPRACFQDSFAMYEWIKISNHSSSTLLEDVT
jgi:hypothetical protein